MSTRVNSLRIVMDNISENPTWDECYAVCTTERRVEYSTTDMLDSPEVSTRESPRDMGEIPDEKDPVDTKEEQLLFPAPSEPYWTSLQRISQARSRRERRARGAAASNYYRENCGFRGPVSERCRFGCHYCNQRGYTPRSYPTWRSKPKIYRLSGTSWKHLPVVIEPTKWYQVVGSEQCSLCSDRGRHQKTSWMCPSCEVPLCLMPYRNCYTEWHEHRGTAE
ncbi:uncharacterized protein LOC117476102 [Trematomus bernacchii]|uniref:uncharacterized protein LOC117476102 n=1 Tax=Trematomus bernacchii TaxID=40690 RepID=UPI00146B43A0|nr:uncharacterized protein LOC117476102 [Trematomus bernacchii]